MPVEIQAVILGAFFGAISFVVKNLIDYIRNRRRGKKRQNENEIILPTAAQVHAFGESYGGEKKRFPDKDLGQTIEVHIDVKPPQSRKLPLFFLLGTLVPLVACAIFIFIIPRFLVYPFQNQLHYPAIFFFSFIFSFSFSYLVVSLVTKHNRRK